MARIIRADRSGPAVIPGPIFDARSEASRIVEQARADSRAIRERAERDAERLGLEAREQGLQEGRAEAAELLERAARAQERALAESEEQIVQIAMAAAQRIVAEHLALSPATIASVVAPVLARARKARRVVVRVNPQDATALEQNLAALQSGAGLREALVLEADESITRGGCLVVTDIGSFDARIEVQLEALARALKA